MEEVFERGGARIGLLMHATWPFCDIRVTKNLLELNASIIGKLVFRPGDIDEIKVVKGFFKGYGLKIIHHVQGYKSNVFFQMRSAKDPNQLLNRIKSIGFLENHNPIPFEDELTVDSYQRTGMFSLKPSFAIVVIVIFNQLTIINMDHFIQNGKFTIGGAPSRMVYGFGFLILTVLSLLLIPKFRGLALKPGRSVKDMRMFLVFALLIFSLFFCLDFLIPYSTLKP